MKSLILHCPADYTSNTLQIEVVEGYIGLPESYDGSYIIVGQGYLAGIPKHRPPAFSRIFLVPDSRVAFISPAKAERHAVKK